MAKLLLDHNVRALVADLLRAGGHDAATAQELGYARIGDDDLLLRAAERGLTVVTQNVADFELLHDAWRRWTQAWGVARRHAGVLILPQPLSADNSALYIQALVGALTIAAASLENELYRWRPATGWRRRA